MVGWLLRCPLVSSLRPLQIPQATAVQPVGGTLYAAVAARNATNQNPCEAKGWVLLGRAAHFAQRWVTAEPFTPISSCCFLVPQAIASCGRQTKTPARQEGGYSSEEHPILRSGGWCATSMWWGGTAMPLSSNPLPFSHFLPGYCKLWASDQNPCEARGWVLLGRAAHFAQRWLVRNQYVVGGYCRVVETLEEKRRKRNAPPPPPPPPEEEEELKRMAEEDGALQTNECPKLTCNTVTRGYMFDHEGKGHFNFTYTGIGPARPHTCYLLCRRTPGCAFWMYNMRSKRVQASPSEVSGALWLGLQPLSSSRLDVPEHSRVCLLDVQHAVQASPSEVSGALWLGLQPLSSSRLDVPENSRVCLLDVQHAVQARCVQDVDKGAEPV
ncbi:unnamed protein product [Closterium sp. NIES-65]|nr:unnamed protein product [Closterium sp. NIES-65]